MFKTSLAVAMFLGATDAHRHHHHAPVSVNYFADGMQGHEDLNEKIQVGRGADKVVIQDFAQKPAQNAAEVKNGCEKGETMVDGNCTFEFTAVQLEKDHNAKDIANGEVRPDVWVEVHKMVNPTSNWRSQEAPKSTYIPSPPAAGPAQEPEAPNPTPKEVDEKIKKDKAAPEESKEERDAKKEAKPVKKPNPDHEEGDLEPPKEAEKPTEELAVQVLYDRVNHLWRY